MGILTRLREATAASAEPQLQRAGTDDDEKPDDLNEGDGASGAEDDDPLQERDFSAGERKAGAKSGAAMPDGSYPINNTSDLGNAVQAFGRAKDPGAVKAHIIKRARALGASDQLPDDWKGSTKEAERVDLHASTRLMEARKSGSAYEVVIIQEGLGNKADSHYYTKEALREAVASGVFADGLQVYADHPTRSEERDQPERSIRKLVGHYRNVRYREAAGLGEVVGELVPITGPGYEWVTSLLEAAVAAEENGATRLIGISIDGGGVVEPGVLPDGQRVNFVREVLAVPSADLVTRPGAGGRIVRKLLESLRHSGASRPSIINDSREERTMKLKLKELQEKIAAATARLREAAGVETDDEEARTAAETTAREALDELDGLSKAEVEAVVRIKEVASDADTVPVEKLREVEAERDEAVKERDEARGERDTVNSTIKAAELLREAELPQLSEKLRETYVREMVKSCADEEAMTKFLETKREEHDAIVSQILGSVEEKIEGAGIRVALRETGSDDEADGKGFLEERGIPVLPDGSDD